MASVLLVATGVLASTVALAWWRSRSGQAALEQRTRARLTQRGHGGRLVTDISAEG